MGKGVKGKGSKEGGAKVIREVLASFQFPERGTRADTLRSGDA